MNTIYLTDTSKSIEPDHSLMSQMYAGQMLNWTIGSSKNTEKFLKRFSVLIWFTILVDYYVSALITDLGKTPIFILSFIAFKLIAILGFSFIYTLPHRINSSQQQSKNVTRAKGVDSAIGMIIIWSLSSLAMLASTLASPLIQISGSIPESLHQLLRQLRFGFADRFFAGFGKEIYPTIVTYFVGVILAILFYLIAIRPFILLRQKKLSNEQKMEVSVTPNKISCSLFWASSISLVVLIQSYGILIWRSY